ncbi:MAG: esterase-like activity of phytase family protein [Bacteroidales bacterium]
MKSTLLVALTCATAFVSCQTVPQKNNTYTTAAVETRAVTIPGDETPVYIGGYGSSMVYDPADSCFYILTDRGPNVDGLTGESKVFPIPDYSPMIGRFRLQGDSLVLIENIILKDSTGLNLVGLPNKDGDGVTGEIAYNLSGKIIRNPSRGIDSEGLALGPDSTFWVSDEYAPFIMQFDRQGKLLRELSPSKGLPEYYAKRRPNRGMEGVTITKDGKYLYGIMQSPLYYPDKSTKDKSLHIRIIQIDLTNDATKEYIYQLEDPKNVVSEISYINDSTFLVLERDGDFPIDGKGFKKVFRINLNKATDISGRAIELYSPEELMTAQINPSRKELFVDLLEAIPGYRHDKPEGITMYNDSTLCVVNDDDFGIDASLNGKFVPKTDAKGKLDRNVVYFIPVSLK